MFEQKASTTMWKSFAFVKVFCMNQTSLKIDEQTGAAILSSGFILRPNLTMAEFRASKLYDAGNVYNPNTPWYYHRFTDGRFEEMSLSFVVCFYENARTHASALTDFSFSVARQIDVVEMTKPEVWNADEDAKLLILNRRLLEHLARKPHYYQKNMSSWDDIAVFQSCAAYDFAWGKIWCGSEDIKTNMMDVSISVRYFDNTKWAYDDYSQYMKKPKKTFWKSWKK